MSEPSGTGFTVSIAIDATPTRVWNVLLDVNEAWASAFGAGTRVDTVWHAGSPIVWCDESGNVGASGIIEAIHPPERLQLRYYDEAVRDPKGPLGEYTERFAVSGTRCGPREGSALDIKVGHVAGMDEAIHRQMWEQAAQLIKARAEAARLG